MFAGQERSEFGVGHRLLLDEDRLHTNLRTVQERNDIELEDLDAPIEAWDLFDAPANQQRRCPPNQSATGRPVQVSLGPAGGCWRHAGRYVEWGCPILA